METPLRPGGDRLANVRNQLATTIRRGSDLLADLIALDEGFQLLMPSLGDFPDDERKAHLARLCGFDEALPQRLHEMVEGLADVLAGLTTSDGSEAWLRSQLSQLDPGEEFPGA
jgi:hypothetical protein